jgi:hypothetical protein
MTMKKFEGAYPGRPYILDLDRDYQRGESDSDAAQEFASLKDETDAYSNWTNFIADYPNATPAIQHARLREHGIVRQIRRVQEEGRTFCVRIELERFPRNLDAIVSALEAVGTADFFFVLEGGLQSNVLDVAARMSGLISGALAAVSANVPIVISATSMRKSFSDIETTKIDAFRNRELVRQIARQHNDRTIVYGDWGSTRPRTYERGSTPLPRIDYPLKDAWMFARSKGNGWGFKEAAEEVVKSPEWEECYPMGIWGEEMILGASRENALAVNSVQKNIAARVNIHLHKQAFYDAQDYRQLDLDEPWTDI